MEHVIRSFFPPSLSPSPAAKVTLQRGRNTETVINEAMFANGKSEGRGERLGPHRRGLYSVVYCHRDVYTKVRVEGDNRCGRRWERDCHAHTGKNESEFKTQLFMATELKRRLAHLRIPQEKTPMLSIELC